MSASPSPYARLPEFFSPMQWETFYAIASAVLPPSSKEEEDQLVAEVDEWKDEAAVREYARRGATVDNEAFRRHIENMFENGLMPCQRRDIGLVLNLLSTWAFCRVFTFTAPVKDLPLKERQDLLALWTGLTPGMVAFPPLRLFAKSMCSAIRAMYIRAAAENPEKGLLKAMGFEQPMKVETGDWFPFEFMQVQDGEEIETDVVIVGSGPGGGIMAEKIAKAGYKVLVVEKGEWFSPAQLPLNEDKSGSLFESGMLMASDDGSISILAGGSFGGGGTVNWSACLQPQGKVREEWVKTSGLELFTSAKFQDCLDTIVDRLGVAPPKRHNHRNTALMKGAKRLGFNCLEVPQNTGGVEHWDGHCGNGCGDGVEGKGCKAGPTRTTLPEAAKNGAKFMTNFQAQKVTFNGKVATGIKGKWTPPSGTIANVTIKAKRVISCCGALQTPLLLQRSGISNPHVGRHLKLHPTAYCMIYFDKKTKPTEGGILTTAVTDFEDLDGEFHGVKLETAFMGPIISTMGVRWTPGVAHRKDVLKYDRAGAFISICRDSGEGRVYEDPETGRVKVEYTPTLKDMRHNLIGIVALAKMTYTQGAVEMRFPVAGMNPYIRPKSEYGQNDPYASPSLMSYIEQIENIRKTSKYPASFTGTAHQMGTARMGKDYKTGAVDGKGRVWGKRGLYVADGSLLPSACGVNPQMTIMALSEWVGENVLEDLRSGGTVEAKL